MTYGLKSLEKGAENYPAQHKANPKVGFVSLGCPNNTQSTIFYSLSPWAGAMPLQILKLLRITRWGVISSTDVGMSSLY